MITSYILVDREGFPLATMSEEEGELSMRLPLVECFFPTFSFPVGGAGAVRRDCCG